MRKLRFAGLVLLVAIVAVNGLAAVGERLAYGAWWRDGRPVGLYRDDTEARQAPSLGRFRVLLQPGAHLRGFLAEISINQLGFRGAEIQPEKPANGLRIWCLGGSTTFDIYAPDDASAWPALVGERVRAARPDRSVEVVNAGIPGEVLSGNTTDLLDIGVRVRPDVVVVYGGPNDLRDVLRPRPGIVGPPPGSMPQAAPGAGAPRAGAPPLQKPSVPWRERLDFALVRVVERWAQDQGIGQRAYPPGSLRPDQRMELRRRIEATIAAATRVGGRVLLATHALRAPDDATGEEARRLVAETAGLLEMDPVSAIAAFREYNQLVGTIAKERALPLADVRAAVPSGAEFWGDATHFHAPGSEKAADAVAAAVLRMSL